MNHLPFRPDTPALLGALLARTGHAQADVELSEAAIAAGAQDGMLPLEERVPPAPPPMEMEDNPIEETAAEMYIAPSEEESPLAIEHLEFDQEESGDDEEVVEVSMGADEPGEIIGTESSPLDEEALSLELEDLLEADRRSELTERKEADEEALTLEMDAFEPHEKELSPEPVPPEIEGPEELFDSFDIGEVEPAEEETLPGEEVSPEPAAAGIEEPSPGDPEELFSLDDLKGDKVGQYDILIQSPSARDGKHPSAPPASGEKAGKPKEVWDEISKDLQDLDFDLDSS